MQPLKAFSMRTCCGGPRQDKTVHRIKVAGIPRIELPKPSDSMAEPDSLSAVGSDLGPPTPLRPSIHVAALAVDHVGDRGFGKSSTRHVSRLPGRMKQAIASDVLL
jgi:hypothetical protein